ncbi:MAG: RDD family protein [Candidatus Mariimomonas ferrooxydans]
MNATEDSPGQIKLAKAKILNRIVAKAIDFIIIGALLETIPGAGYYAGLAYLLMGDGLFGGRSIGKRLIRLKVVLYETGDIGSYKESIIRNFTFAAGYILMVIPLIGFIFPLIIFFFEGLLMIGNERGMRFGDELVKTQVIEENPATPLNGKN